MRGKNHNRYMGGWRWVGWQRGRGAKGSRSEGIAGFSLGVEGAAGGLGWMRRTERVVDFGGADVAFLIVVFLFWAYSMLVHGLMV